jgi:hypothetical protein
LMLSDAISFQDIMKQILRRAWKIWMNPFI